MRITQTARSRKRHMGLVAAAGIALISVSLTTAAAGYDRRWQELWESASIGHYELRVYAQFAGMRRSGSQYEDQLIVTRAGRVVERLTDFRINVVPDRISAHDRHEVVPLGTDMTGDGQPNVLVATYSGGAHCCHSYYIYSVGEEFRRVQAFYPNDSSMGFLNLDDDPALEAELHDFNFAYW